MSENSRKTLKRITILAGVCTAIIVVTLLNPNRDKPEKVDSPSAKQAKRIRTAQQFLDELRKGVKRSDVKVIMETPEAPNTIALIRQFHDLSAGQRILDKLFDRMPPDIRGQVLELVKEDIAKMHRDADADMEATHRDIRIILEDLHARCGVREVYVEGLSEENEKTLRDLPGMEEKIRELERRAAAYPKIKPHLDEVLGHQKKLRALLLQISPAPASLFFEGKITIHAGEIGTASEELFRRFLDEKTDTRTIVRLKMTQRELELLESLAKRKSPRGVAVYGGAHGLTIAAAVAEWNAKNPSEQFHCVVITPHMYAEIERRDREEEKKKEEKHN